VKPRRKWFQRKRERERERERAANRLIERIQGENLDCWGFANTNDRTNCRNYILAYAINLIARYNLFTL